MLRRQKKRKIEDVFWNTGQCCIQKFSLSRYLPRASLSLWSNRTYLEINSPMLFLKKGVVRELSFFILKQKVSIIFWVIKKLFLKQKTKWIRLAKKIPLISNFKQGPVRWIHSWLGHRPLLSPNMIDDGLALTFHLLLAQPSDVFTRMRSDPSDLLDRRTYTFLKKLYTIKKRPNVYFCLESVAFYATTRRVWCNTANQCKKMLIGAAVYWSVGSSRNEPPLRRPGKRRGFSKKKRIR